MTSNMFINSLIALTVSCLALPLTSAIPTSFEGAGTTLWLGKRDANLLTARNTIQGLPTCKQDPSYAVGPSRWKDGEGTFLGSDCDANQKNGDWHCWTDYFSTGTQARYDGWAPTGNEVDCASTQSCNNIKATLSSTCKTVGWSIGVTVTESMEVTIGAVKGGVSIAVSTEINESRQICASTTDSTTCTWNDSGCHAIWKAERTIMQLGYTRRTCKKGRSGVNMPEAQQLRPDGYYTVGMQDYAFDFPSPNVIIGCAAKCGATSYPSPAPASDTSIKPPVPVLVGTSTS